MTHNHPQLFELLDIVNDRETVAKIINETKNHTHIESAIQQILTEGVDSQNIELINIAINNGAKVIESNYLLRNAIQLKNNEIFELLLKKGADPFAEDGSALYTSAYYSNSYTLKRLIQLGVSATSQDNSPIKLCGEYDQLENVKLLYQHGADLSLAAIGAAYGNNPHIIEYAIKTIGIENIDVLKMIRCATKERAIKTLIYLVEKCNANIDLIIQQLGGKSKEEMEDFKLRQRECWILNDAIKNNKNQKKTSQKL